MENFDRLSYDPDTGIFTWANPASNSVRVGGVAGAKDSYGYLQIGYGGKLYLAHRLAWYVTFGDWPKGQIDHIDGDKLNNRISNLRDVSQSVNQQNQRRPRSDSTTGLLGAHKSGKKWRADIRIGGRQKYLGLFDSAEQAHAAYLQAKRKHHEGCMI